MMRKSAAVLIVLFLLTFVFTGCGIDKETVQSDFSVMVSGTTTPENIRSTAEYMDDNIKKVGKDIAAQMLSAYEDYLHRYISENPDKLQLELLYGYYDKEKKAFNEEKIKDSEISDFYDSIRFGSLIPVCNEDSIALKINYPNLLEKYGEYISVPMHRLYELKAIAVEKPMSQNAALLISWEELSNRALEAEKLLKEFPGDELVKTDAMWLYTTYLNTMLMGTTNTPIFDYSTTEFSPEARKSYERFMLDNPDATITWVLKEYFTYLYGISYSLNFNDSTMSKVFFDTCDWLVSEAEKRVVL